MNGFCNVAITSILCLVAQGCYRSERVTGRDSEKMLSDTELSDTGDMSTVAEDTALDSASIPLPSTDDADTASTPLDDCGSASYSLPTGPDLQCVLEEVDFSGNGSVNQRFLEVHDAAGALLYSDRDEDGDGDLEVRRVYSYGDAGLKIQMGSDMYGDGSFESVTRYRYDDEGRLLEALRDSGVDCTVDQRTVYDYGDANSQTKSVTEYRADGTVLRIDWYFYDDVGRLVRRERDPNGDGDISARTRYDYNAADKVTVEVQDLGSDASVFLRKRYSYDTRGLLMRMDEESGDGALQATTVYGYTEAGLLAWEQRVGPADLEEHVVYTYDADGRLLRIETTSGPEESVDAVRRFSYVCSDVVRAPLEVDALLGM